MGIGRDALEQAYSTHKAAYGGTKEDYFALLYLAQQFEKSVEAMADRVAFGESQDEGINAFHVDVNRRNLYLYQCQWASQPQAFKEPLRKLSREGMERIFGSAPDNAGRLLSELRERLHEDQAAIDKVIVHFVFNGDPSEADQSAVLDALREDLESKKHLVDQYFGGRNVTLSFQYVSNETRRPRAGGHTKTTHRYTLALPHHIASATEGGEQLHVGFVRLLDLYRMYREMGQRLFERNIRAGLDPDGPVNKKIRSALADVLDGKAPASAFVFNHNGVTISAERIDLTLEGASVVEPRVLNGAQTITSLARFLESYDFDTLEPARRDSLEEVRVLAKIVTGAEQPFVTAVTINTNRQNPVEPANLRASDQIQLELQDKFRQELSGLLYERQERLFSSLSDEEKADQGFDPSLNRAIEMKRLAKTFLAAQGEMDRMLRLNEVFETESQYRACFSERYLKSDARRILLAYKMQYRINKVAREIESSARGYDFVPKGKNLLWALLIQGALNHPRLPDFLESYGGSLKSEAEFTQELVSIGVGKVKHVIREAVSEPKYKEQLDGGRYSFLRTKAVYTQCMDVAGDKYGWTKLGL